MERYGSPLGEILLSADEEGLTGLWLPGQRQWDGDERGCPVLEQAKHWLDLYFSGREPDFCPPLHLIGTAFQLEVWQILLTVPYGQTVTYGQIARRLSRSMSAQAVGGAVGRNPISIIVPCHRVIGADGSLTGYAGGLDKKLALLTLEGVR